MQCDPICADRREELSITPSHTHRWMLSVTAPSYVRTLSPLNYTMCFHTSVVDPSSLIHDAFDSFGSGSI
jgi:hypothetical protein